MKKLYQISVVMEQQAITYVYADSEKEALKKAEELYGNDQLETEWGSTELDHEMSVQPLVIPEADYRGDPVKIGKENEKAYKELKESEE